jgi:Ni/Fe-hydrogenase 1 B-type cytochrome subunit
MQGASGLAHDASSREEPRETLYVWELPVRLTHWTTVIALGVLTVTGIYIANPFIGTHGDATNQYLMGSVRFTHYVAAFVFTASVLLRIYWAFVGNKYARWRQFIPTTLNRLRGIPRMLSFYLFLRKSPPETIGHNTLAGLTYAAVFTLFILQIITGFALYSLPFSGGVWPTLFGWVIIDFGTPLVRLVHDLIMWLLIAFTIHHVYSAILIDTEEKSGLISSILTGYKSLTRSHIEKVQAEEASEHGEKQV